MASTKKKLAHARTAKTAKHRPAKKTTAKQPATPKLIHNQPQAFSGDPIELAPSGEPAPVAGSVAGPALKTSVKPKSPAKPKARPKPTAKAKAQPKTKVQPAAPPIVTPSNSAKRTAGAQMLATVYALRGMLLARIRLVSLLVGLTTVSLWTIIRHITNGVNFDVVGQIGLAQQWAHGLTSGAQLGATNYLLKIPLYMAVNQLHFLSPMNRILLLALVCNLVTFWLLFWIIEKVLRLYGVASRGWFYLAMLWLATIAGGVFWVDYANSRNVETLGGIAVLYLVLKYAQQPRLRTLVALVPLAGLVFFADSLQFYVCGLGICLYAVLSMVRHYHRRELLVSGQLLAAVVLGYGLELGLKQLAIALLPVTFLVAPNAHPALNAGTLSHLLTASVSNTFKAFDAAFWQRPLGLNSLRELLNFGVLLAMLGVLLAAVRKTQYRVAVGLVGLTAVANYGVYAASGQALQWSTSRYLLMLPLIGVLLVSLRGTEFGGRYRRTVQYTTLLLISLSGLMLLGALVVSLPSRHSKDAHIYTTVAFLKQRDFQYALSTREVGITTTYFAQGASTVLPMACQANHTLAITNLFYDKAAFAGLYSYTKEVPVILPMNQITFGTNHCTVADVIRQFGYPKHQLNIPDVGTALVYDAASLQLPDIDKLVGYHRKLPAVAKKAAPVTKVAAPVAPTPPPPPAPAPVMIPGLAKLQGCPNGSLDTVVAHPDDDLLFIDPSLYRQFNSKCVRTVFVTAADDGRGAAYWQNRELGIQAAYASLYGAANDWQDQTVMVDGRTIVSSHLANNPSVGLLFLRLPDGDSDGGGFARTGHVSLEKLVADQVPSMTTVDGSSTYNHQQVIDTIAGILATDQPDTIYTQLSSGQYTVGDHSDHRTVGALTLQAIAAIGSKATVQMFVGYPANGLADNLSADDTVRKRDSFYAYALDDSAICGGSAICSIDGTYGRYFSRSYTVDSNGQLLSAN